MSRLAPLLGLAACLTLNANPASALSALFDFNDFPYYDGDASASDPAWNQPFTYDYSCNGQPYCTGGQVWVLNTDNDTPPGSPVTVGDVVAVRNGIGMEILRPGSWSINWEHAVRE